MPKAVHSSRERQAPETPVSPPARTIDEEAIAVRAYELWQDRGAPIGSPEVDWFQAESELNSVQPLVMHG